MRKCVQVYVQYLDPCPSVPVLKAGKNLPRLTTVATKHGRPQGECWP